MAIRFTTPETYSDADMLAFVKQAIVEVLAAGQSHALPGGRQWFGADLDQLQAMERAYQARVDSATSGRAVNYVRFSR